MTTDARIWCEWMKGRCVVHRRYKESLLAFKAGRASVKVNADLLTALKELYAMVCGECPSLLRDDHLDVEVRLAISSAEQYQHDTKAGAK